MYVDTIEEEAERIGDLAELGTKVTIRTVLGGDLDTLLAHLADVYRRASSRLGGDLDGATTAHQRAGETALAVLEGSRTELVSLLRACVAGDLCSFGDELELTAGELARQLAHETAIHRVDAELARGPASAIDPELAADGVDERLNVDLARRLEGVEAPSLGGSICLICSDQADAWSVEVHRGRYQVRPGRRPADAAVVAPASDLFRFSWNRPTARPLQVTGRLAVVEAWQALPGENIGRE